MNGLNPRNILGGIPGLFEEDYEREKPILSSVTSGAAGVVEDFFSLVGEMAGVEDKSSSENDANKLSIGGQTEIDFNNRQTEAEKKLKDKTEADRKKDFHAQLEQDRIKAQQAKEKMLIEEEIIDISSNMSTEDKNRMLHYQASYKDKSVYQMAALRRKIIEERKKSDKQRAEASIAQSKPRASAMNAAFEGGSGTQGSGTANLSAQATG